jgi:uncharacterized protein YciI
MPYFMVIGRDRPGTKDLRLSLRPAHQAHFFAPQPGCRGVAGGPLVDDTGESMEGSLLVFEADDRAAVDRFLLDDPYCRGGLFESVEIKRWRWGLGAPPHENGSRP